MKAASPCFTEIGRADQDIDEHSPLTVLPGIGPRREKILGDHGFKNIGDLLDLLPKDYLDLSKPSDTIHFNEPRLYQAILKRFTLRRLHNKRSLISLSVRCCDHLCTISLFNQPYLEKSLKAGTLLTFHGQAQRYRETIGFTQPLILAPDHPACMPRYRSIGPLSSDWIHRRIILALNGVKRVGDDIPEELRSRNRIPERLNSWQAVHQPVHFTTAVAARTEQMRRLAYREFMLFHLQLSVMRQLFREKPRRYTYGIDQTFFALVRERLPFQLTPTQERSQNDILNDLRSGKTMQRLLCGDVGSGKTIVAFISILAALHSGYQAALLVPTDILARQHHGKALHFFREFNTALLCGDLSPAERKSVQKGLESGSIRLIIGTHALLQSRVRFASLSLVVIDEQHRFGVSQRATLHSKNAGIDLLSISATPIPRTLLLSHYSDMRTSTITDLPPGRAPVVTRHVTAAQRSAFYRFLSRRISGGEKAFVIVPRIVPEEGHSDVLSIEKMAVELKRLFSEDILGIAHGRMDADQRQQDMLDFLNGRKRLLLATSVVEVGIDDPNVTIVVIENADRFGLATLHQLRGRVGRGQLPSSCFLISSPNSSPQGLQRIGILCRSGDGFLIARKDLQMRGGGLIAGSEQIGGTSFRYGDPFRERTLYLKARQDVADALRQKAPPQTWHNAINEYKREFKHIGFS